MKHQFGSRPLRTLFAFLIMSMVPWFSFANTTINNPNQYAYGANIGWMGWRGDVSQGAVMGQYYATGYVYSANCGWVCLGFAPTNGYSYSNASADDFGVNHDGFGNLTGFAYGANIGWINFEQAFGQPKIDLMTGKFDGFAYGANIGWISLSNAQAHVQTDVLDPGPDTDGDMIPDAWEFKQVGGLLPLGTNDFDGDGVLDLDEYTGDTNPDDINEFLQITHVGPQNPALPLVWDSKPTRLYRVLQTTNLLTSTATDVGLGIVSPDSGTSTSNNVPGPLVTKGFIHVEALVPLAP